MERGEKPVLMLLIYGLSIRILSGIGLMFDVKKVLSFAEYDNVFKLLQMTI